MNINRHNTLSIEKRRRLGRCISLLVLFIILFALFLNFFFYLYLYYDNMFLFLPSDYDNREIDEIIDNIFKKERDDLIARLFHNPPSQPPVSVPPAVGGKDECITIIILVTGFVVGYYAYKKIKSLIL